MFPGGKGEELHVVLGRRHDPAGTRCGTARHEGRRAQAGAGALSGRVRRQVRGRQGCRCFDLTVKRIEDQSLPDLDEAFVRGFGLAEGGIAEFRTQVRATMEQEVADTAQQRVREQLLDAGVQGQSARIAQGPGR